MFDFSPLQFNQYRCSTSGWPFLFYEFGFQWKFLHEFWFVRLNSISYLEWCFHVRPGVYSSQFINFLLNTRLIKISGAKTHANCVIPGTFDMTRSVRVLASICSTNQMHSIFIKHLTGTIWKQCNPSLRTLVSPSISEKRNWTLRRYTGLPFLKSWRK